MVTCRPIALDVPPFTPRNAVTPATPTSSVSPVFSIPKLPDSSTKPPIARFAEPPNCVTSSAESNLIRTSPPGVTIVVSIAASRRFIRASMEPVRVNPLIPTSAALPDATRAYFVSPPLTLSMTAPIFPSVRRTPVPFAPRNVCTPAAATRIRVVVTPPTVVVVSSNPKEAEMSTKPAIASWPEPPKRLAPGASVRSSAVDAVPKSSVTDDGPVLRSACSVPVSVRSGMPTSDAVPRAASA